MQEHHFTKEKQEDRRNDNKTRKIGIIGAGNVGSHLALQFAVQGLADEVVFYDINNDKAHGESLDLLDAVSYQPHHFEAYAGTVADMKDADDTHQCVRHTPSSGTDTP